MPPQKLAPIMTKRINNTINRAKPPPNPNPAPPSTNPDIYKPPFGSKEELTIIYVLNKALHYIEVHLY
jgi:hypothetical protein